MQSFTYFYSQYFIAINIQPLFSDVAAVIHEFDDSAPVVLVGHSMGGAVAVRAASLITNLAGVTVIDVVEGTAMDALASMQSFLRSRPKGFDSIPQAIEWWFVSILSQFMF